MESGKKKVMVAIDQSECSHYALEWTLQSLRETLRDSKLIIFTAQSVTDYAYLYASSFGAPPIDLVNSIQERQKKNSEALLEKAREICSKYGVAAETFTQVGDPKEVICEAVEKYRVELLVVGSHSRGVIQRAFLGSVSNYCVHNAKSAVLVVKK